MRWLRGCRIGASPLATLGLGGIASEVKEGLAALADAALLEALRYCHCDLLWHARQIHWEEEELSRPFKPC